MLLLKLIFSLIPVIGAAILVRYGQSPYLCAILALLSVSGWFLIIETKRNRGFFAYLTAGCIGAYCTTIYIYEHMTDESWVEYLFTCIVFFYMGTVFGTWIGGVLIPSSWVVGTEESTNQEKNITNTIEGE